MKDYLIGADVIKEYRGLLSESYIRRVEKGDAFAVLTVDNFSDDEPIGLCILGTREDWTEILWLMMFENFASDEYAADLIRRRMSGARAAQMTEGVFAEFEKDTDSYFQLEAAYQKAGFSLEEHPGSAYSFTLEDIDESMLPASPDEKKCICLANASDDIKRHLAMSMQTDKRNIPIELPVDWSRYDGELSVIHMSDDSPNGVVLVERNDDTAMVSLAYTMSGGNLMRMISVMIARAEEILSEDTTIIVPVVEDRLHKMMENLAPDAERPVMYRALYTFPAGNRL